MKRLLLILLTLVICFGLTACGKQPVHPAIVNDHTISRTKYFLDLCYEFIFCPLLEIVAGGLLIVGAKQLTKVNANQRLIAGCNILGAFFLLYTIITTAHYLGLVIHVFLPPT